MEIRSIPKNPHDDHHGVEDRIRGDFRPSKHHRSKLKHADFAGWAVLTTWERIGT